MDDWVPKKLEISLEFDPLANFDFTRFKGNGLQPNENPMPNEVDQDNGLIEPELNMEIVNQLLQMGVPEIQAKHAVYNTGNCDAEAASMWFFENIENPLI